MRSRRLILSRIHGWTTRDSPEFKEPPMDEPGKHLGKIIIAGGSGFLGVSLAHALAEQGSEVVIVSQNQPRCVGPW